MTKPIHALTAYVPTDVWCRLLPRSPHCAPGSLLPGTPTHSWVCPEYRFSSGRIWRRICGVIHIHDSYDTWWGKYAYGVERQEICLRSHTQERWPHYVNGWRREINAIAFPPSSSSSTLSVCLSLCYLYTFHSASTQPLRLICQTWRMQSEAGYRWIRLPSLSSPDLRAVCNTVWDGKGQIVNQPCFFFSAYRIH